MPKPKETLSRRIDRLENIAVAHDAAIDALIESQRRTDKQMAQTERRLRETDQRLRELAEQTDKRVADLVSAIGEFSRKAS